MRRAARCHKLIGFCRHNEDSTIARYGSIGRNNIYRSPRQQDWPANMVNPGCRVGDDLLGHARCAAAVKPRSGIPSRLRRAVPRHAAPGRSQSVYLHAALAGRSQQTPAGPRMLVRLPGPISFPKRQLADAGHHGAGASLGRLQRPVRAPDRPWWLFPC